jgi:hypothetical protein
MRKKCQWCRYTQCEKAGMKAAWVLTEEERKQKSKGRKEQRKSATNTSDKPSYIIDFVTIDRFMRTFSFHHPNNVRDIDISLLREVIRMVAFRASLSREGLEQLQGILHTRCAVMAHSLVELRELQQDDKDEILRSNLGPLVAYLLCVMLSPGQHWVSQLVPLLGRVELHKLSTKLLSLGVTGLDRLHLPLDLLCPVLSLHTPAVDRVGSWAQDTAEHSLLALLILFCPDMLHLRQREQVENTQIVLATTLQRYLHYKHPAEPGVGRARFTRVLVILSTCKELGTVLGYTGGQDME